VPNFDLIAKAGEYTDRDGNTKARWVKCGMLIHKKDGGWSVRLDAIPAGNAWDGWLNAKEIEPRDGQQGAARGDRGSYSARPAPLPADGDEEIPF
jgi:hypothetical protein